MKEQVCEKKSVAGTRMNAHPPNIANNKLEKHLMISVLETFPVRFFLS
jgi:hypothetical protein